MEHGQGKTDCIFCMIINGEIPSKIVYQDEDVVVFPDINPVTPVHLLIVTKKQILSLARMADAEMLLVGKMVKVANKLPGSRVFRKQATGSPSTAAGMLGR